MLFELLTVGPISDQGQPGVGQGFQHRPDAFDLLFSRQTAHVEQKRASVVVAAQQALTHGVTAELWSEQLGIHTALPQVGVLDSLLAQLLHHRCGGAEVEHGLVVGGLEQLPKQGLEHAHAVVLEIFGQMGVVAGDQGNPLGFGQPDAAQAEHGGVDHMNEVGLEAVDRVGDRRPRQGQLQFGVEGQGHGRYPHQLGAHVLLRAAFGAEHHHLITGLHQMLHRFGEPGDDAVDLGEEGFGEKGDFHGNDGGVMRIRTRCRWPWPASGSRRRCTGCDCDRSGRRSGWRFPPLPSATHHPGWWD